MTDREWLEALRTEIAQMADDMEVQRRAYVDLIARMDELRGDLDRTSRALDDATAEIARIHASRAWRVARRLSRGRPPHAPEAVRPAPAQPAGTAASAATHPAGLQVSWPTVEVPAEPLSQPIVSIIVPTRDRPDLLGPLLATLATTDWPEVELVLVDNGTTDDDALQLLGCVEGQVVRNDEPFNFPGLIQAGVDASRGDVLVLLNNDIEVVDPAWLRALVACLDDSSCGVAGGLLEYPDGRIQHAGLALEGTQPVHALAGLDPADAPAGSLDEPRECIAVTGACMALRRSTWAALDGMDSLFARNYNDVDLCMRARSMGLATVFTPRAALIHKESATRGTIWDPQVAAEGLLFRARWADALKSGDPYWPRALDPMTGRAASY